jgi:hypothetical protein
LQLENLNITNKNLQDEKEELLSDNQILALRNIEMRKEIDTEHGKLV